MFNYGKQAVEWLTPVIYLIGLVVATWAFLRCRRCGYVVVAIYFALCIFMALAMPSINRAIRAHRAPDFSAETRQKIEAAVQDATRKVLAEAGHPEGIPSNSLINWASSRCLRAAINSSAL